MTANRLFSHVKIRDMELRRFNFLMFPDLCLHVIMFS